MFLKAVDIWQKLTDCHARGQLLSDGKLPVDKARLEIAALTAKATKVMAEASFLTGGLVAVFIQLPWQNYFSDSIPARKV